MTFDLPPVLGTLIRRYKRFLADVRLDSGDIVTAHCANTGSMLQMAEPGSRVMLTEAANPARKTRYDWRLVEVNGHWAGIDTAVPNILVAEGFTTGIIPEFRDYTSIRREVPYGSGSRVDAVLSGPGGDLYVEAKNVTLVEDGRALFPDAVTARGAKHLDELMAVVRDGGRAAMFFLAQRMDCDSMGPAEHVDPVYAAKLREAVNAGVGIIAWRAEVTLKGVQLEREIEFVV